MKSESVLLRPYGKDPVFRLITVRDFKRVFFQITLVYIFVLLPFIVSYFQGTLFPDPSFDKNALKDIGYYEQYFFLLPFLLWFSGYYLNGLEPVLNTLRERGIIKTNDELYKSFSKEANKIFEHPLITYLPYVLCIVLNAINFFGYWIKPGSWYSPDRSPMYTGIISTLPVALLLYYLLPALVLRIGALYFVIKKFLLLGVAIQPLHPDKSGGMSPLGSFSLRVSIAGIISGVAVSLAVLGNVTVYRMSIFDPINILTIIGYILCLTVVFFLPLMAAKNSMQSSKRKELQRISDKFNIAISEAMISLEDDTADNEIDVEKIEKLNKLYSIANRMPIYPFNAGNVFRFFSSVLWPIIFFLAQELVKLRF